MGHGEVISNCELRNWEPARRVGVRRTIANLKSTGQRAVFGLRIADCGLRIDCSIAQSEMGAMPLEVGGALRLRLEAVGRFEILDWRL